jgi:cytochrome c oxidase subunit 1
MSFSHLYTFASRCLFSTNHIDIGILYLIFGGLSGILGTTNFILIKMRLARRGHQIFFGSEDLYNVLITGEEFYFIFFVFMPIFI